MKQEIDYTVYATDTDGSERKAATVTAKSVGHAREVAGRQGVRKITDIVAVKDVKTVAELMSELRLERRERLTLETKAEYAAYEGQFR